MGKNGCLNTKDAYIRWDQKKDFFFNSEQIDRVVFKGYADEDEERFQQVFTEWQEKNQIPLAEVEHSEQDEEDKLFGGK